MRIRMHLSIGYPGADHEDELEIEDDYSPKDIDDVVEDWANNYIEWWHEVIEEDS